MLDNFLSNVELQPLADVANNLVNKLSKAIGFIFLPRGKCLHKIEAEKYFIEQISKVDNIDIITKASLISNTRKIIKEFQNQNDIVQIALENLKSDATPNEIDDSWLMEFMEKCKNICDDEIKIIWGKILAEECNTLNSVPKKVFNVLPYIGYEEAKIFEKICKFTVYKKSTEEIFPFIEYINSGFDNFWTEYKFSFRELRKLEEIGLIIFNEEGIYLDKNGDEVFVINGEDTKVGSAWKNKIYVGNIIYTKVGATIAKILESKERLEGFSEAILGVLAAKNFSDSL